MSVLDTIKEAEAVAQQKKTGAAQQARETVAKAQEDAREKARDILRRQMELAQGLGAEAILVVPGGIGPAGA